MSIVEESEQQDFFDEYVSLNVSNVRMVQESCEDLIYLIFVN